MMPKGRETHERCVGQLPCLSGDELKVILTRGFFLTACLLLSVVAHLRLFRTGDCRTSMRLKPGPLKRPLPAAMS